MESVDTGATRANSANGGVPVVQGAAEDELLSFLILQSAPEVYPHISTKSKRNGMLAEKSEIL